MTRKAILLGGALTFALTGAAFAQADTQSSPTPSSQSKPAHHLRHHAKHHMATAYLHQSSPAERGTTRDLNLQQASMVQTAAPAPQDMRNMQNVPPGDRSLTPMQRLPNGNALQSATPAGGAKDTGPPPARY
jgi:hypothetical protein